MEPTRPEPTRPEPTLPPPGSDGERALERRIVLVWRLALIPALLPPAFALGLLLSLLPDGTVRGWTIALPAALLAGIAVGPLQTLRWRRWSWRLTDRAVELRSGVITRRHVVVPHFRVQQIDVLEGPIERLLGLATLRVTTASASGSVELPGLPANVAPLVRGELLARAARANEQLGRDGHDAV
jgi:membrane protein YdbS with pleckstrin-like domain